MKVRGVLGALVALALSLGLVTARVVVGGEDELARADASLRANDNQGAIEHARRAARWYVPGAPHVPAAYARLVHVARTAEANGDRDTAVAAWRAVRSAAAETAWIVQPHAAEMAAADEAVARLVSSGTRPLLARDETPEQAEKRLRALLAKEDAPRAPWLVALVLGMLTMIAGAFAAASRGVKADGSLDGARVRVPALITVAGVALYALAVWQA